MASKINLLDVCQIFMFSKQVFFAKAGHARSERSVPTTSYLLDVYHTTSDQYYGQRRYSVSSALFGVLRALLWSVLTTKNATTDLTEDRGSRLQKVGDYGNSSYNFRFVGRPWNT